MNGNLLCVHTFKDLIEFAVLAIPWFITFFYGMINGGHIVALIIWIPLAIFFFIYFEALVLCRHCPHYAEQGKTLRCHANYGLPKIPKINPRSLSRIEQISWLLYIAILFLSFIPFYIIAQQWLLLAINLVFTFTLVIGLLKTKCNRCYNLSCPFNRTPSDVREKFFQYYPIFAQARQKMKK
ncbi:MAG TPA: hypothetical protein G4N92_02635 [Anaerolineae bacterium]|nr:hypothetical protein [Anaerolineae bacterium]